MAVFFSIGFIYIYYFYNPAEYYWFPKCPVKVYAHIDCPGCGSQRAIHSLLHGDFRAAFKHNMLVIPAIPYVVLGFGFQSIKEPTRTQLYWRKLLYGESAIKVIAVLIFVYFILRNL